MKTAVITGASSGIGREFVRAVAEAYRPDVIWAIARRTERLNQLETLTGGIPVRVIPLDLLEDESFEKYSELLKREKPDITVLVNAAGFGRFCLTEDTDKYALYEMIDLNDKALVRMTMLSLPFMSCGGTILNMGSLSSFQPVPYINVYAASKAFVLSFSRALNVELEPRGIRVTAVCPGWVRTEFFDHAVVDNSSVTYFNKVYEAKDVAAKAVRDAKRGRDVSILGFRVRAQVLLVKLLPHRLVMKAWLRQQKHM